MKYILIPIFCFLAAFFAMEYLASDDDSPQVFEKDLRPGGAKPRATLKIENSESYTPISSERPVNSTSARAADGKDDSKTLTLKEYLNVRGYFVTEDRVAYDAYSEEALLEMGHQGDLAALDMLEKRYRDKRERSKVKEVEELSILMGSSRTIRNRASNFAVEAGTDLDYGELENASSNLMKAAAWYEVGLIRGDLSFLGDGIRSLNLVDIEFTKSQLDEITAMAQEKYNELLRQRRAKGLGDFPDLSAVNFPAHERTGLPDENVSGWGKKYYSLFTADPS